MRNLHADEHDNPGVRRMRAELAAVGPDAGLAAHAHRRLWGRLSTPPEGLEADCHRRSWPVSAPDLIGWQLTAEAAKQK